MAKCILGNSLNKLIGSLYWMWCGCVWILSKYTNYYTQVKAVSYVNNLIAQTFSLAKTNMKW